MPGDSEPWPWGRRRTLDRFVEASINRDRVLSRTDQRNEYFRFTELSEAQSRVTPLDPSTVPLGRDASLFHNRLQSGWRVWIAAVVRNLINVVVVWTEIIAEHSVGCGQRSGLPVDRDCLFSCQT